MKKLDEKLVVKYVQISEIKPSEYNPRKWDAEQKESLKQSLTQFGIVDPLVCNSAEGRMNILLGGHFRLEVLKELEYKEVPVVYINISDIEKEKELNIRLNKNTGEFDLDLLAEFDEALLSNIGFDSEELDTIFNNDEDEEEQFDLKKELEKLNINEIKVKKGDVYELDGSRLMCGDSTIEEDMLSLMGEHKADMVMTDPPYILDYLHGKTRHGEATEGFGSKKNRRYLETDVLPDNFTELWMGNIQKIQKENFHIVCYENWKNIRTIWNEMEKHWKVRNMIVWHLPNRVQGYSGKYKLFNKYDIAMVGTTEDEVNLNTEKEDEIVDNEYETALYATSGSPHWESYGAGKKICPTDFIEFKAADEKSSGQGIIFGTKPLEILMPYIKILTERDDLVVEPFGGSGSTLIASIKMKRRCFLMEKSPVYVEVILRRWRIQTGKEPVKIYERA
ncbi:MAG: DNA methyltransferase [Patescibacteria group bacterium]